jgi:NADH:ubiquinone oxidoreductase subunit 4 (subunit M)
MLLFITFSIKIPTLPFHTWLTEAHVEAPTSGSIILASILLKLGAYGFIRYALPLSPNGFIFFMPLTFMICLVSTVYSSLNSIRQVDLKRMIAYSSIAHMNFALLGLFTLSLVGVCGSFYLFPGHGLVSAALFFNVGVLYDRYHTRLIFYYGGLTSVMPLFSSFFIFFLFPNAGFPSTVNFLSEFFILNSLAFFS